MAEHIVDLKTWPRAAQFALYRTYDRPHYAVTSRLDVTGLMARKAEGVSVYRACLYAIGAGIAAVPELSMRLRGEGVVRHDAVQLSMTVPTPDGSFAYGYVRYDPDWPAFEAHARAEIAKAAAEHTAPVAGERDDLIFLSCMPWLDYTSINNVMSGPSDCIPRVSWGKIVPKGAGWDMAMTLEVHHALVDGQHVGAYFAAVQAALDGFAAA